MNPILTRNQFFVKEHVGMFKAANSYDILDLESQQTLLECRELNLGFITKVFRFTKLQDSNALRNRGEGRAGAGGAAAFTRGFAVAVYGAGF